QLASVEVARAHLPGSLVELATRYVELCDQLAVTVEQLFDGLGQAEGLLAANDLAESGRVLADSRVLLTDAQNLLDVLDTATVEVFTLLRRSGGGTAAELDDARTALDAALALLLELTEDYERRMQRVDAEAVAKQKLQQPVVSATLDRDAVWVGEALTLLGEVRVEGAALGDREMDVLLDGAVIGTLRTDSDGRFLHQMSVPFEYLPRRSIEVAFSPRDADLSLLLPATSGEMVVTPRYHESALAVAAPALVYPGYPVVITGNVVSTGNVEGRQIDVCWHGAVVGTTLSGVQGTFRCTATLPFEAVPGEDWLEVYVANDNAAKSAPATLTRDFKVSVVVPRLVVEVPQAVFVPSPSLSVARQLFSGEFVLTVPVEGVLHSSLPLGDVSMVASWDDREVRWNQLAGEFARDVPLRMSVWSMGVKEVTVRAIPREPWHRPAESHAELLVVNLFIPVVWTIAVATALILAVALRRRFGRDERLPQPGGFPEAVPSLSMAVPESVFGPEHSGPRHLLVYLYYRAVALLQTVFGTGIRGDMTLREYRATVARHIPSAIDAFSRLTSLAERALYAGQEPAGEDLVRGTEALQSVQSSDDLKRSEDEEESW
ncbi:MAG: DUF4129 domain-containing protein, partial [Dehalococcoidia bacterium]|nr:DUF4129 domain-containing protein [Dehalococcoidia bacterium]